MTDWTRRAPRVLLVEDNAGDVLLTRAALADAAPAVDLATVGDGEAALAYLRREGPHAGAPRPDLVLCDLNLPRLDGREVLEALAREPGLRTVPVVMLSSSASAADVAACYARGARAYVVKPLDFDGFRRALQSVCRFWLTTARLPTQDASARGEGPGATGR